jgi:alkylmercury lyase
VVDANDCCTNPLETKNDLACRLAITGFQALWHDDAAKIDSLIDLGDAQARAVLADLERHGRLELDRDQRIVGIHGVTQRHTRHRVEHAGGTNYTWCAFDAVGIPAALEINATATTDCPTCGLELRVHILEGEPAPALAYVLWLPTAQCEHLMNDFCSSANLFCSEQHVDEWVATGGNPAGSMITLADAAELGRRTWGDVAGM